MSFSQAWTDVCAARRDRFIVGSANQRSTRFGREALVGVKCVRDRGRAGSRRSIAVVLCVASSPRTRCTRRALGNLAADLVEGLPELLGPVAAVRRAHHPATGRVQRGGPGGGARPHVVAGVRLGTPGSIGGTGWERSGAGDLGLLVHAQHERAFGRVRVPPDHVVHLPMENGSVEKVNDSCRWRCRPKARQIRGTADRDRPVRLAVALLDQYVALAGVSSEAARHGLDLLVADAYGGVLGGVRR
ncbi:hypothetical protein [Marinitenerispora sediminis]|uniref:Uncharacterized protein n=1 Tax=Marinitenerispora sediminis TaxID=1931232 RepID=A0A368T0T7_9ACTN|nr:hypothetical protein [Marinitenerispora sediminis]RCV50404.1 hypothetical protein DEF23_22055 [Marinitenerispora sediminis]RCV53363.1 hypothetical protein DEF24_20745 [Marinitenerispora sediminis]RCV56520.1 hypothetical protein DEF28_03365 [Marinitenerispora sediminis]